LHTEILLEKLKGECWHIKETGCLCTDWFHVVQDVVQWRLLQNRVQWWLLWARQWTSEFRKRRDLTD